MHDHVYFRMGLEAVPEIFHLPQVTLYRRTPLEGIPMALLEVIKNQVGLIVLPKQFDHVRADVAGSSDYKYHLCPLFIPTRKIM
jgi:hypothetical protein